MNNWHCRTREISPGVYETKDCSTGDYGIAFDAPGLPLGDCSNPSSTGCYGGPEPSMLLEIESGEGPVVIYGPGANVRKGILKPKDA